MPKLPDAVPDCWAKLVVGLVYLGLLVALLVDSLG